MFAAIRQYLAQRWAPNYVPWGNGPTGLLAATSDQTTMALQSAAVWACLRLISVSVASLPAHLFRETATGKEKAITDPAYGVLCKQPNFLMTLGQWMQATVVQLLLYGNSFTQPTWINGGLASLWLLDPLRMRIVRKPTGEYVYSFWDATGQARILDPDTFLHFRLFSLDGVIGLAPVDYQRMTFNQEAAASTYAASLYENGGQPSGILEYPGNLKPDQIRAIRDAWSKEHAGPANVGRVAILDGGTKFQPISIPLEQMQYIAQQKFSTEQIARIFGVPPHMIGAQDKTPYASVEQQSLEFSRYTLQPIVNSIERTIESRLVRPPLLYRLNVSAFERADIATRYRAYATGRQWGWFSCNDILALEDMDSIGAQGDVYLQPLNMADAANANLDPSVLGAFPVRDTPVPQQETVQ